MPLKNRDLLNKLIETARDAGEGGLTVVTSRSHASPGLEDFLRRLNVKERVSRGSSLEFCLVAEGVADIIHQ